MIHEAQQFDLFSPRQMHPNSIKAHREERAKLSKREAMIMDRFNGVHKSQTDRNIMEYFGFKEMNAVRPRITSLIQNGHLVECGNMIDRVTGRRVRLVRAS